MFIDKMMVQKSKGGEQFSRSFVKAFSWRLVGTIDTVILAWLITGKLEYASMIGGAELITKMVLYIGHERIWDKITWGRKEAE